MLAAAAFLFQAVVCLFLWLLVDDGDVAGAWTNEDFYEWVKVSGLAAALCIVSAGTVVRRWWVTCAFGGGCLLAVISGIAS